VCLLTIYRRVANVVRAPAIRIGILLRRRPASFVSMAAWTETDRFYHRHSLHYKKTRLCNTAGLAFSSTFGQAWRLIYSEVGTTVQMTEPLIYVYICILV
jgi:hypothetical protein